MHLMMQQDKPDDYVISTGVAHSIRDFLQIAFTHVGINDWEKLVETDPRFKRPAEVHLLLGDSSKAKDKLGWQPKTSFEDMVKSMVDVDIQRLS